MDNVERKSAVSPTNIPTRKDTPAPRLLVEENLGKRMKEMEIPEILVESRDSDCDSGIKDVAVSDVQTPSTSPTSSSNPSTPRFTVNPVSSRKNSEEQKFKFQLASDAKISDQTEENNSKINNYELHGNVLGKCENGMKELQKKDVKRTEKNGDPASSRKVSEAPSSDSQPKSRKVSFLGDGQANGQPQFYLPENIQPGYLVVPSAPNSRRVSSESFYGQHPSRKSSLNPFYYPVPGHNVHEVPHHKISVFSMQSYDSERTFTDTHEVLPHEDHYRDLFNTFDLPRRPTLFELREEEKLSEPLSPGSVQTDLFSDELCDETDEEAGKSEAVTTTGLKFGWIQGVLVRCLLNIFGVMLFLRLTWVTGQAGIGLASVIILLSMCVTIVTTMSMSAICTNGEVKGGGAYYMISRSLGPEFGGSIGIVFSLANAIAAAMYVVGFAETVRDIIWENAAYITGDSLHEVRIIGIITCFLLITIVLIGMEWEAKENAAYITGDSLHEVRIIGIITCFLLITIVLIGMEWEAKAQMGLLVILIIAIFNYFIGTFIPPSEEKQWKGVVGYKEDVFSANFGPSFRDDNSFFSVFAIFFPAATGILAGANISGDLKDPQKAIPKGTFLAIIITGIIYLAMVWVAGSTTLRDAVGPIGAVIFGDITMNVTASPTSALVSSCESSNVSCEYGLIHDNGMVGVASAWRPLILAGIFSATLSSALASLVGAPKVFQALGKDKLFPGIHFFAKGYGSGGEPRRGYVLTFMICVAMTCVGSLDLIAPIISNFFLMAYALINYSCFDASIANTPGFRPAFKYYSKWASLVGALLCVAVMFLVNWWAALVTFVIVAGLFMYVKVTKPDVNWGSSTQAHAYREALKTALKLVNVEEHVKNFRPQILVLSGFPRNRAALVDLAASITKKQSLLISGHIFQGELSEHLKRLRSTSAYRWFKSRQVKAFYNSVAAPTFRIGVQVLLQALGLGKLKPNTLLIGYKSDWIKADPRDVFDYYNVIQDAFDLSYGVGVLRIPEGLDRNKVPDELLDYKEESDDEDFQVSDDDEAKSPTIDEEITISTQTNKQEMPARRAGRSYSPAINKVMLKRLNTLEEGIENVAYEAEVQMADNVEKKTRPVLSPALSLDQDKNGNRFKCVQNGTIDVWWLYDDGGLTLLVPYILSQRKRWKNCSLRVFCAGTKKGHLSEDQIRVLTVCKSEKDLQTKEHDIVLNFTQAPPYTYNGLSQVYYINEKENPSVYKGLTKYQMAALLSKFRINYSQLTVIPDLNKKPQLSTYKEFESLIHKWRLRSGEFQEDYMWKIADSDLIAHKHKTYRHLRIRELLKHYSSDAALIVMTLPVPRKTACPAGLYMGWLEIITRDMSPILLLRAEQAVENTTTLKKAKIRNQYNQSPHMMEKGHKHKKTPNTKQSRGYPFTQQALLCSHLYSSGI